MHLHSENYFSLLLKKQLWCCSSGDHPYIYLAKFGDVQNMKVKNLKHLHDFFPTEI
jgi:hypothetical protein